MGILISVLTAFGAALLAPAAVRYMKSRAALALSMAPAGLFLFFLLRSIQFRGAADALSFPWVPALGLHLSFRADGLSLLFAMLISGMGLLVAIYSSAYMKRDPDLAGYYGWLMTFTAAMLGLVLADNLLLLYVFWELTSISSFMLIGHRHEEEAAREAALQSLLVTSMGGLALLAGGVLLGLAGGTFEISALVDRREQLQSSPLLTPAIALILLGAFTKSAQFPFHFWLPNAMQAPTPVSAYLHSAAMVKAGIYLLARLTPALEGNEFWTGSIVAVGVATLLLGAFMALAQTDLKLLLAYSTISALGLMTLLIGLRAPYALHAAIVFLAAHALYKGALFLVAGAVDHGASGRDVENLGGLRLAMPITAFCAATAALSMAGVIPFFGAISKELSYEAGLQTNAIVGAAVIAGGASFVFVAAMTGIKPFWGRIAAPGAVAAPHEVPYAMWLGPALLAFITLALGIAAQALAGRILASATAAITGAFTDTTLRLWHGITPALIWSGVTLLSGAILFLCRMPVRRMVRVATRRGGPEQLYRLSLVLMNAGAVALTRILQTGYLRHYIAMTVLGMVALVGIPLIDRKLYEWPHEFQKPLVSDVLLAALILAAAFLAVRSRSILGAVAAMGVAGYGVAVIFMVFSAPDLALTQFLIESLTVILFVLVFYRFPSFTRISPVRSRLGDGAVALAAGAVIAALVLLAAGVRVHHPVSEYFVEAAAPEGHGRNIVNVILVDFRALDTLGETTVLAIAAIGVYVMIRFRKIGFRRTQHPAIKSLILHTAIRFLMPLLLLFSLFLLVRGHNYPGGGFSGGLVAAAAWSLYAVAHDATTARKAFRIDPRYLIGVGMIVTLTSGAAGLVRGEPFLSAQWAFLPLGGLGNVAIGTPLLFDAGVYVAVVGVTLTIVFALEEE